MVGFVLRDNQPMRDLVRALDFKEDSVDGDRDAIRVVLPLGVRTQ